MQCVCVTCDVCMSDNILQPLSTENAHHFPMPIQIVLIHPLVSADQREATQPGMLTHALGLSGYVQPAPLSLIYANFVKGKDSKVTCR